MTTQILLYNKIFQDYKKYYYNKEAKFYRKKIFLNQMRRFGDKKKSVIEIGCGPGYSFKLLKDLCIAPVVLLSSSTFTICSSISFAFL